MSSKQNQEADFYTTVGNKIMLLRKEKGIDQEALGAAVGLSRASIINIEKARQRPSLFQIWLMAQYLNIPITDLIPPPDIEDRIDDWKEKVDNEPVIEFDAQKQDVLGFISATRRIK